MKILVNDGVRPSLGVVRSLGRKGFEVGVLTETTYAPVVHSRYCKKRYLCPPPGSNAFMDAVLDVLRRESYDAVIPIGYEATLSFAEHRDELAALTRVGTVDARTIRMAANKEQLSVLAARASIPVPRAIYPETLAKAVAHAGELGYPIVIKAVRETRGNTVRYADRPEELSGIYRACCEEWGFSEGNVPMLQEYIPGFGCGFFALYQYGACKRIFMHRRIRENPPTGGVSTCAESFFDPTLKEYGMRLLDSLNWHGVAMVEFRHDIRDGDFKLMEINPRFWGSLDLALAAGVDFPYDLCRVLQGSILEYSEDYNRKTRFHWPYLDLQHVCRRPSSLGTVVRDSLNPRVASNVWPSDPVPNVYEGLSLCRSIGQWVSRKTRPGPRDSKAGSAERASLLPPAFSSKRWPRSRTGIR